MFFLMILRCYKHFAPLERRHRAAKSPQSARSALPAHVLKSRKPKQPAGIIDSQFPGAVIDGGSFVDCILRGVRSTEVVEAGGSILFRNVKIEPAEKGRSLNSRPTWP